MTIWYATINKSITHRPAMIVESTARVGLIESGMMIGSALFFTGMRVAVTGLSIWVAMGVIRMGLEVAFPITPTDPA